jgi:exonuclease III
MRLVAWNANFNNKRRSLEEDVKLLEHLNADVIVLSETSPPCDGSSLNVRWIGTSAPCLSVVTRAGLSLDSHSANIDSPNFMGGFYVLGELEFALLAIWPVQRSHGMSYHEILTDSLSRFSDLLSSNRTIMAGDFNSNNRVKAQQLTHPQFVREAAILGLVSAYHVQFGEKHGDETVETYRQGKNGAKKFHIDYCFLSQILANSARMSILRSEPWYRLSDHYPIVLDVPDSMLRA